MRFQIVGANAESGDDVSVLLEAPSRPDVEKIAHDKGILVSTITPLPASKGEDPAAISLVDDEPAAAPTGGNGSQPHAGGRRAAPTERQPDIEQGDDSEERWEE